MSTVDGRGKQTPETLSRASRTGLPSLHMDVRRFTDEYVEVAPLYGLGANEFRRRTRDRWIAVDEGHVIAAAETLLRPDGRLFLTFEGEDAAAPHLAHSVADRLECPVYAIANEDSSLAGALLGGGCTIEMTNERFVVSFASALRYVRRSRLPARYRMDEASRSDPDRLFALDNRLRNLVQGTDGWSGNRGWFDEELSDPASYRVASDRAGGEYVGLARMWRNPSGPRFGLIGVLPHHRHPSPAPALLRATLEEASTWGFETFTTETTLTNRVMHPRLSKIGTPTGRFHQLVLRPTADRSL